MTRRRALYGRDRGAIARLSLARRVKGNDSGGNTTVHFYYSRKWQILEMRNGSNQATRQFVYGTQYVDEPLCMDVNATPNAENDCDPDVVSQGDLNDRRYTYAQDRNWNVVALLETDDGIGAAGAVAERYAYTPYGGFVVEEGGTGGGRSGSVGLRSAVGNLSLHRGLTYDPERIAFQNRIRTYASVTERFTQRDRLGYRAGMNSYSYSLACPPCSTDPCGLSPCSTDACNLVCNRPHAGEAGTVCEGGSKCHCICTAVIRTGRTSTTGIDVVTDAARTHEECHVADPAIECLTGPDYCLDVGTTTVCGTTVAIPYCDDNCRCQMAAFNAIAGDNGAKQCEYAPDCKRCYDDIISYVSSRTCQGDAGRACCAEDQNACQEAKQNLLNQLRGAKKCCYMS